MSLQRARSGSGDPAQPLLRPSDLALVVAGLSLGREWFSADEVAHRLGLFGFDVKSQQIAPRLVRMTKEDAPRFRREERWGYWEYSVNVYGRNEVSNKLEGLEQWR